MLLLYKAVSSHLHEEDDTACLQRATMIRTVLAVFARRVEELTRSDKDLKAAIVGLKKLTE